MKLEKIQKYVPVIGFVVVVLLFTILTGGKILAVKNIKMIAEQSILLVVGGIGVIFVMSTGGVDFSQGSIMGITCVVGTLVAYTSIPLALLCMLLVGGCIGFCNGLLTAKGKVQSFVVTICMMYIFRGVTAYVTRKKALEVPAGIYLLDNLTFKIAAVLVLLAAGYFVFAFTRFGREVRAVGAGEVGAKYAGIDVTKVKIIAFTAAGCMASMAAFMNMIRVGTASANTGSLFETNLLIALVLGGMPITGGAKSRYISIVIGGVLLAFLANGLAMLGVDLTIQQFIRGAVFLGTVMITVERGTVTAIK